MAPGKSTSHTSKRPTLYRHQSHHIKIHNHRSNQQQIPKHLAKSIMFFMTEAISANPSLFSRIHGALLRKKSKKPLSMSQKLPASPAGHDLRQVFRCFDEDGDGKISPAELCSCLRSFFGEELLQADAKEVVESSDSDGDGMLGYEDFLRLVEVEEEEERGRSLREAFSAYEMKGKGFITARSLRQVLQQLGEDRSLEECKGMIRRFDLNGDGVLSFEEFEVMML